MGSGKDLILNMLFTEEKTPLSVTIMRFFAPILTYISGGAGGICALARLQAYALRTNGEILFVYNCP